METSILKQIKDNFNRGFFERCMQLTVLPKNYFAWTLKGENWVGVAVPIDNYRPFSEKFSNVTIKTEKDVLINNIPYDILLLKCTDMTVRDEFAVLCCYFVDPGTDGRLRSELVKAPEEWWGNWKKLLGNVAKNDSPYSVLGELLMLERLLSEGIQPVWTGKDHATHDIETDNCSIEVKSTTLRYGYEVTISSIYQMKKALKPLYLIFTRFEESRLGRSINDVVKSLLIQGYDEESLELSLKQMGLEKGRTARDIKYKVIEWKRYCVDDSFPCITEKSFKNDRLPNNITRFTYTIDLSGIVGMNLL